MTGHPLTLYGFLLAALTIVCVTVLAALSKADESVLLILSTIGGAGVGAGAGVAVPRRSRDAG